MTAKHQMSEGNILVLNAGSSSLKFAVFRQASMERILTGMVERIGRKGSVMRSTKCGEMEKTTSLPDKAEAREVLDVLMAQLIVELGSPELAIVGHRVVHGIEHIGPEIITPALLAELRDISPYDPEHLPREIELMEALRQRHPELPQVACFDTGFHRDMPRLAKLLPIPRRYEAKGVRRYGFHGLSYAYLMEELKRLDGPAGAAGRVILAHLGNGASMAAVRQGNCLDTSMGFTPTAGLMMGTRSGDLDPGVISFLARTEKMTAEQFHQMVNHESGLLGVSETGSDMRNLLALESKDGRAAEAVALFCYHAKKWIGSLAAVLGGLDTLIFTGGIGENCPSIRARICEGLGFLGVELDEIGNAAGADIISKPEGQVTVRMIRTDEAQMIARSVCSLTGIGGEFLSGWLTENSTIPNGGC